MSVLSQMLANGFFAAVAAMGFALISNPPGRVLAIAGVLGALGYMTRFALMQAEAGIAAASLCAGLIISLCSMPCARRCRIPAEMFAFPALLPMIPGMFAYKAIFAIMQFMGATGLARQEELMAEIAHNGLTALFIMGALVLGAVLPLHLFHRASPLAWGVRGLWARWRKSSE